MFKKLAAFERQNQVDIAVQEIGRIERTLSMFDWLENPALCRRCQAGQNKSEQPHALAQAVYTFRQGRIIDRSHEAQQYRAFGLNLVIAAIVYWNSTYMAGAVMHFRSLSEAVPDDLLAYTSPVCWEHIACSGDFLWDRAAQATGRKPLNLPSSRRAAKCRSDLVRSCRCLDGVTGSAAPAGFEGLVVVPHNDGATQSGF